MDSKILHSKKYAVVDVSTHEQVGGSYFDPDLAMSHYLMAEEGKSLGCHSRKIVCKLWENRLNREHVLAVVSNEEIKIIGETIYND